MHRNKGLQRRAMCNKQRHTNASAPVVGSNKAKRKFALILFGLSYQMRTEEELKELEEHPHDVAIGSFSAKLGIDWRRSVANYEEFIFKPLAKQGWGVDVFLATNELNQTEKETLLAHFKPVDSLFTAEDRNTKLLRGVRMAINRMREKDFVYDGVLLTRFDLICTAR